MERILTLFLLAMLLGLPQPQQSMALDAPVSIELWTTEVEPERMTVIRYLADAFMALNDDIRVQVVPVQENEVPSTLRSQARSKDMPTLIYSGSEQLIAFAQEGWLDAAPATAVVDELGRGNFFNGALDALSRPGDGAMYAVPFHGWVQGIWYRADWFAQAGLEPPDTLDRIMTAAKRLHDPQAGRYGILIGTKRDNYAEQVFTHLALAQGIKEFNDKGQLVFNTPRTAKLLEYYKQLAQYTPEGPQNWRARDFYLQGKLAMMFYSTFIMDDLALSSVAANSLTGRNFEELGNKPFDPNLLPNTQMVPVITGTGQASYGVIVGFGFGQGVSPAKRAAATRLLRFLFRTDCYVTWLHMAPGGMLPVLRAMAESDSFYRDIQGVFRRYGQAKVTAIIEGLDHIRSFSVDHGHLNPMAAEISTAGIIPGMIHKTLFEDLPAKQSLDWAEREMQRIMQERVAP